MDHIIYTSMTGAGAAVQRQAVLANNLANAGTQGFRAGLSVFRAVPLQGDGAATRVFAIEATAGHDDTPGPVQRSGRNLDAMAQGQAWFAVQGPDGAEAYTRAGSFEVSAGGQLQTATGLALLSDAGAAIDIPPGAEITLAADGAVSARSAPGQPGQTLARIKLATPAAGELVRGDDGLFRTRSGAPLAADSGARLLAGALEGANVNPVACMVAMIAAARQFEQQMRLLQSAEGNDKSASQLLGVAG